MAHLYKCEIWTSASGRTYCGDTTDLVNNSGAWWIPCNILGMTPVDFVLLLKENFNASSFNYDVKNNVLIYSWNNIADAIRYRDFINRTARELNVFI